MPTLSFKVSPEEDREIRARARAERVTVSEFLRRRSLKHPQLTVKVVRLPSGRPVFDDGGSLPPLTSDSVRDMLEQFP